MIMLICIVNKEATVYEDVLRVSHGKGELLEYTRLDGMSFRLTEYAEGKG